MNWFVDLYSTSGVKIGPGPIASARQWNSINRMDRAGSFSFEMSGADPLATLVTPLTVVRCYALVDDVIVEVGAGLVELITTDIGADGKVTLVVSGSDLLAQLAQRVLGPQYIDGSTTITPPMTPVTHANALAFLENVAYTTGWRMTPDPSPPIDSLVGRWNYESVLTALVSLAGKCQTHFYVSGYQRLTCTSTTTASGVRAVAASEGELGSETAAIAQLRRVKDAADVVTTVIPFGAGNADARLTAKPSTRIASAGYSSPTSGLYYRSIRALTSEALYGQRMRVVVFNDITPISSTDADVQAAANALWDAAFYYLKQHEAPAEFYDLTVAQCPQILRPMQTIRVVYRDLTQNVNIDADLLILETTTTLDVAGLRTTQLKVSTVDRYPESDNGAMVGRLASGQMYQAAPQLNANSYVISYTKPVDEAETASFRFRFDSEVVQLTRCTFDFQILPLESTVKTLSGSSATTSAGGATTSSSGGGQTSSSGGAHTHTVSNHTHTVGDHTHTVGDHTHTVSNHTHTVGNHTHGIELYKLDGADASNRAVYHQGSNNILGVIITGSGTYDTPTSNSGGSTTSSSGGGQTTSSGGATTSSSGGGQTTSSGGGQTSSSDGSHTHTVSNHTHTIGDHTHDFTPTLTANYGIFRDSAANTFALTDLEYSVDATTWYAFAVSVNGFASLGDSWYRIDITALIQNSTTLRPLSNNNALQIRRKSTGATKKAMIEGQLNVRTIIQAIAAL